MTGFIGENATQEDIERGLASDKEVTRKRWESIQTIQSGNYPHAVFIGFIERIKKDFILFTQDKVMTLGERKKAYIDYVAERFSDE